MAELAYPSCGFDIGIVAAGAITAYSFVGHDRDVSGANEIVAGIALATSEEAGDHITIRASGVAPVLAGSDAATNNLSPGTAIKSDAEGKAIRASAATDYVVGRIWCDSPTGAAEDALVLVQLTNEGRESAT